MSRSLLRLSLLATLASGVMLAGCSSTMRVRHAADPDVDFLAFATFDWRGTPDGFDDPLFAEPDLAFLLRSRIRTGLEARGYQKVDRSPDLFVVYHVALETRINRGVFDRWGYRYPPYGRPGRWVSTADTYEVGTLVIDVIDARTDELVWRGVASDAVSPSPSGREAQVEEAVSDILSAFPSR